MQTCPFCQAQMTIQTYAKHIPSCIYDPEVREIVGKWAKDNAIIKDGIAHFPTNLEYRRFSGKHKRAPASQRIVDLFGTWGAFRDFVAPDMPTLGNKRGEAIPDDWPEQTADAIRRVMAENGLRAITCFDDIEAHVPYPYKLRKAGLVNFCSEYGIPCTVKERNTKRGNAMDAPNEPIASKGERIAAEEYMGTGYQVTRRYTAVYSQGGRMYQETRFVLR